MEKIPNVENFGVPGRNFIPVGNSRETMTVKL